VYPRRRLSGAAPSLSGLLSPRYSVGGGGSPSSFATGGQGGGGVGRVTSRSVSPPASPDHHDGPQQRRHGRQKLRRQVTGAGYGGGSSREGSPPQPEERGGGGMRSGRRKSLSMSWSAASLSSIMSYSSASSVGTASTTAADCPLPPPAAATPAPGRPDDDRPLSPPLAITVMGAAAPAVRSSGGPPSWEPAHEADAVAVASTLSTLTSGGTAWTGGAPAAEAFPAGGFSVATDGDGDDGLVRAAAGDAFSRTSPPPADREAGRLKDSTAGRSDGGCSPLPRGAAPGAPGDGVGDRETGILSGVMESCQGTALSPFGDSDKESLKNASAENEEREKGVGPTQVLGVPEVGTRNIDEFLSIQVRHGLYHVGGARLCRPTRFARRRPVRACFRAPRKEDDSIALHAE